MSFESLSPSEQGNHFNLIRLAAASAVIVSHSYTLSRRNGVDPLARIAGFEIGTTAVIAFFAISGFFISLSFERRRSDLDFIFARVTRIIPGLFVVSLLTAFVVGPLFTKLSPTEYFSESSVWLYPLQVTSIYRGVVAHLPDVFPNNPLPYDVNNSLWTLFYELACYIGLFIAGSLGFLRSSRLLFLVLLWSPTYLLVRYGPWPELQYFAVFSLPFVLGMVAFRYRSSNILRGWLALPLVAVAVGLALNGIRIEELWSAATAYAVLWLGFAPAPRLLGYNRAGDYSYGTYIYGFVIQQMIAALMPDVTPLEMISLSLPLAVLAGALSWYLVERPAIALRRFTRSATTTTPVAL